MPQFITTYKRQLSYLLTPTQYELGYSLLTNAITLNFNERCKLENDSLFNIIRYSTPVQLKDIFNASKQSIFNLTNTNYAFDSLNDWVLVNSTKYNTYTFEITLDSIISKPITLNNFNIGLTSCNSRFNNKIILNKLRTTSQYATYQFNSNNYNKYIKAGFRHKLQQKNDTSIKQYSGVLIPQLTTLNTQKLSLQIKKIRRHVGQFNKLTNAKLTSILLSLFRKIKLNINTELPTIRMLHLLAFNIPLSFKNINPLVSSNLPQIFINRVKVSSYTLELMVNDYIEYTVSDNFMKLQLMHLYWRGTLLKRFSQVSLRKVIQRYQLKLDQGLNSNSRKVKSLLYYEGLVQGTNISYFRVNQLLHINYKSATIIILGRGSSGFTKTGLIPTEENSRLNNLTLDPYNSKLKYLNWKIIT